MKTEKRITSDSLLSKPSNITTTVVKADPRTPEKERPSTSKTGVGKMFENQMLKERVDKVSPKKSNSPKKKESSSTKPSEPKVASQKKGSIASFFGKTTAVAPSVQKPAVEIKKQSETPKTIEKIFKDESKSPAVITKTRNQSNGNHKTVTKGITNGKKTATDAVESFLASVNGYDDNDDSDAEIVPATPTDKEKSKEKPPAKKRQKKISAENEKAKKRSRIMAVECSSDEGDVEMIDKDTPVLTLISPKKEKQSTRRNKAKRVVSKTYQGDDGFISE